MASLGIKELKKHDKIVLSGKAKLNRVEVVISKASNNSNISHDEFVSRNNMLKEFDGIIDKNKK